jgi:hypothetical protein
MTATHQQRIDPVTIIGLGLILMPVLTMWHEIGGHASACLLTGGTIRTIGAFYVDCDSATLLTKRIVAWAGVSIDSALAVVAWPLWRRARGDMARLVLWLIAVSKGFVAAGYFFFSGISGVGDLGPSLEGIGPMAHPVLWRITIGLLGALVYWRLVVLGIRTLTAMLGDGAATNASRKRIAHVYYGTIGCAAVLVGLLNPVGLFITILSAAASSFGGNAGFISIGYAGGRGETVKPFVVPRYWGVLAVGVVATLGFAIVLGPSITPG